MKIGTKFIHAGAEPDPSTGAIMTPIYQTSTYVQAAPGQHKGFEYARSQNPTRKALEEALEAYEGTIITISHDRYFLDRIATQILALDGEGKAEHYNGDYTEYHDWKASRLVKQSIPSAVAVSEIRPSGRAPFSKRPVSRAGSKRAKKSAPAASADAFKRIKVIKKPRDSEIIEAEIAELEKQITNLSAEMAKPEVARDITKLVAVNDEYEQIKARLAELYEEWERADIAATSSKR